MSYPWDDHARGWRVWDNGEYAMWVVPMMFNHRLIVGRLDDFGYDAGWCYPDRLSCLAAAVVFDPEIHAEPVGYVKRATEAWVPLGRKQATA